MNDYYTVIGVDESEGDDYSCEMVVNFGTDGNATVQSVHHYKQTIEGE